MAIPGFTIDGIVPPFIGNGPGDHSALMSPYEADASEVVARFGTSDKRREILGKWLDYRQALRDIGLQSGFQWLDGSFLEEKEPKDLDLVSFVYKPSKLDTPEAVQAFIAENISLLDRDLVKANYRLDAFLLELDGSPEALVDSSRYYLQLFSHQRSTFLWKGMVQVSLDAVQDAAAKEQLLISSDIKETEENQL